MCILITLFKCLCSLTENTASSRGALGGSTAVSSASPADAEGRGTGEHRRGLRLRHIALLRAATGSIEAAGRGVLARGPASGCLAGARLPSSDPGFRRAAQAGAGMPSPRVCVTVGRGGIQPAPEVWGNQGRALSHSRLRQART